MAQFETLGWWTVVDNDHYPDFVYAPYSPYIFATECDCQNLITKIDCVCDSQRSWSFSSVAN